MTSKRILHGNGAGHDMGHLHDQAELVRSNYLLNPVLVCNDASNVKVLVSLAQIVLHGLAIFNRLCYNAISQ